MSRRASLLWTGRKGAHSSISASHTALQSQDTIDIVPLNKIAASPTPSPTRSNSEDSHESPTRDPFANPPDALSPFSDVHQVENPPGQSAYSPDSNTQAEPSRPPIPKPLNLPPPRTPPPVAMPLSPSPADTEQLERTENTRWWHDWLCGCGEGPDRGGDFQVSSLFAAAAVMDQPDALPLGGSYQPI